MTKSAESTQPIQAPGSTDPTDTSTDPTDPRQGRRAIDFLGVTLVILRLFRNLSQAELAERAGIRSNQVSRYETQQVLPQLQQLQRLADALDIDMVSFFAVLGRVRALGLSIQATEGLSARLATELHQTFYEAEGLQVLLGERLSRRLTEDLEAARWGPRAGSAPPDGGHGGDGDDGADDGKRSEAAP